MKTLEDMPVAESSPFAVKECKTQNNSSSYSHLTSDKLCFEREKLITNSGSLYELTEKPFKEGYDYKIFCKYIFEQIIRRKKEIKSAKPILWSTQMARVSKDIKYSRVVLFGKDKARFEGLEEDASLYLACNGFGRIEVVSMNGSELESLAGKENCYLVNVDSFVEFNYD